MRKSKSWAALLTFGAAVAGAAWFGSRYTPRDARTRLWYWRLRKPGYNPPNFVFPIVWTTLYTLMAISGWRIWRRRRSGARSLALTLWAAQLAANANWTRLFFGEHRPQRSLADVVLLESMIAAYIKTAKGVDAVAAVCFIPYAAWVGFATLLNADIARRNPDAEKMLPRARIA